MSKHSEQFPFALRMIEKIIILAAFLTPLFFLPTEYPFAAPKGFFITALGCIMTALLATLWLSDRSYIPRLPKIAWVIGAYAVWLAITGSIGANPNASWWSTFSRGDGLITLIAILMLSLGLATVLQKKDMRHSLAWSTVCGGVIVVAVKYIGAVFDLRLITAGGTMSNSSFAGAYLLFTLFAGIYLITTTVGTKKILAQLATIFIATSSLFITIFGTHDGIASFLGEARAAAIALLIGTTAGTLLYFFYSTRKSISRISTILFAIFFLGAGAITLSFLTPHSRLQEAFIETASPTRLLYGTIALEGIATRPLIGVGINNYPVLHQRFYDPINLTGTYLNEGWADKPHNLLLELGASAGLPGLMLYLLLYGSLLVIVSRYIQKGYINRKTGALFFGLYLAYFLQNLFLFEVVTTQFFFWITTAWLLSYQPRLREENHLPLITVENTRRVLLIAIWVSAAIGFIALSFVPAREAIAISRIKHKPSIERTESIEHIFAMASIGRAYDEARFIDDYARSYLQMQPKLDAEAKQVVSAELKTYLAIVNKRLANASEPYIRLVLAGAEAANTLYAFSDEKAKDHDYLTVAKKYAQMAITLSPRNQNGYLELAKAYLQDGDIATAIRFLELAVDLAPGAADPQIVLLNVLDKTHNEAHFVKQLQSARATVKDFDLILVERGISFSTK